MMTPELQKQRDEKVLSYPHDDCCQIGFHDGFETCHSIMIKYIEHCRNIAEQDAKEYADLLKHHKELKKQLSVDYQYQTIKELQSKLIVAKKALEKISQTMHRIYCDTHADDIARQALKEME